MEAQGSVVEPETLGAESLQSSRVIHLVFNLLSFPLLSEGEVTKEGISQKSQEKSQTLFISKNKGFFGFFCLGCFFFLIFLFCSVHCCQ